MIKLRIVPITAMAVLILMSACRLESPGGLTAVDSSSPDKTADEAFLQELEAAYDATTWTEVMFTAQRDDGSYVGYVGGCAPSRPVTAQSPRNRSLTSLQDRDSSRTGPSAIGSKTI